MFNWLAFNKVEIQVNVQGFLFESLSKNVSLSQENKITTSYSYFVFWIVTIEYG